MTPAFENTSAAAQAAAAAEARLATARAALAAAEGEADTIRCRILDLDGQRGAIIFRRQRDGDERDDDGPTLALLAADRDGLAHILTERDAAVAAARAPADAAAAELAAARFQLRRAEAEAAHAALAEHAETLQQRLLETVEQLAQVGAEIGRQGPRGWLPSETFAEVVRRMDIQRQRGW